MPKHFVRNLRFLWQKFDFCQKNWLLWKILSFKFSSSIFCIFFREKKYFNFCPKFRFKIFLLIIYVHVTPSVSTCQKVKMKTTEIQTSYLEIFIVGYSMFTNCLYCLQNFDLKRTHKSHQCVNIPCNHPLSA